MEMAALQVQGLKKSDLQHSKFVAMCVVYAQDNKK